MALETLYTSTKVVNLLYILAGCGFYMPHWDAFLIIANNLNYKVYRDGTYIELGQSYSNTALMGMNGGRVAFGNFNSSDIYLIDPFMVQPIYTEKLNGVAWNWNKQSLGDFIDTDKNVLFHRINGGYHFEVYDLTTGSLLRTENTGADQGSFYYYFYVGQNRFGGYAPANGKIFIYDYNSQQLVGKWVCGVGKLGSYDTMYNLFWVLGSDNRMKIFSMVDCPTNLSNPTFLPTGNKYKMAGYKLTTRLTGSTGNGIAGKQVIWTLTNTKGWLEHIITMTNENGYAYNYYWCPKESPLGSETITVTVNL